MGDVSAQILKYFGKISEKMIDSRHADKDSLVHFESWAIDGDFGLLRNGEGVEVRLEPRLSRLMSVLMSHGGHFVSRRQLIDVLWPESVVTEQSLTRAVSDLRKVLRANFSAPPIIETANKQGYRLSSPEQPEGQRRRTFLGVVKLAAYGLGTLVLFVLILRGINY